MARVWSEDGTVLYPVAGVVKKQGREGEGKEADDEEDEQEGEQEANTTRVSKRRKRDVLEGDAEDQRAAPREPSQRMVAASAPTAAAAPAAAAAAAASAALAAPLAAAAAASDPAGQEFDDRCAKCGRWGLLDTARHVIRCHSSLSSQRGFKIRVEDVAGNIFLSRPALET